MMTSTRFVFLLLFFSKKRLLIGDAIMIFRLNYRIILDYYIRNDISGIVIKGKGKTN